MLCMVTFAINIPPMLAYIPYMDPMGYVLLYVVVADIPFYLSGRSHVIVVSESAHSHTQAISVKLVQKWTTQTCRWFAY